MGELHIRRISFILALTLIGASSAAPQATPQQDLCYPQVFGNDNSLFDRRYPVADSAFDHKRYRESFKAYYQYFFCLGGSESVNPAAEDSGAAALLRGALAAAISGQYREAVSATRAAIKRDARFGEAPFILGNLLFICGKQRAARAAWRSAESAMGYAAPSDHFPPEPYVQAAREMLKRHS